MVTRNKIRTCLELERCQARVGRAGQSSVLTRVVVLALDEHVIRPSSIEYNR